MGTSFDHQPGTFEFGLFGGQLPRGKQRFLDDPGKRSEPYMDRVDMHAAALLRLFPGEFQNTHGDGEFMHGMHLRNAPRAACPKLMPPSLGGTEALVQIRMRSGARMVFTS